MSRFRVVLLLGLAVLLAGSAVAAPVDLTTFGWTWNYVGQGTEQPRVARYTTMMGVDFGDTVGWYGDPAVLYEGAYDYTNHRGNGNPWWLMNNGVSGDNWVCTWDPDRPTAEDFFGYQFKQPATITQIDFFNRIYYDGGTFDVAPRVEVLSAPMKRGGTWSEIPVTWSAAYNDLFDAANPIRPYTITPNAPTGEVWGVRLIGAPESAPGAADEDGFIGLTELRVFGESPLVNRYDLTKNLALGQTPLWSGSAHFGRPQILTDGCYAHYIANYYGAGQDYWGYEDTWGMDDRDGTAYPEEYLGAMFSTPQSNVGAIGTTQKMFGDGGWVIPSTLVVEYTTDGGATWIPVTGLDTGRWAEMEPELALLPWAYVHSELMTFDTIGVAINGIRMRGTPYGAGMSPDLTGFLGAVEFEVFAAKGAVPPPHPGDANRDGKVNDLDASILAANWQRMGGATWDQADFNGDNSVNDLDASILAANWQYGVGAAVPEPGTLALLAGLGLLLVGLRRRK